jgi:hypothetical protein
MEYVWPSTGQNPSSSRQHWLLFSLIILTVGLGVGFLVGLFENDLTVSLRKKVGIRKIMCSLTTVRGTTGGGVDEGTEA